MKMRKYLAMLIVVTLLVSAMALSVLAKDLDPMGWDYEAGNEAQQKAWELTLDEKKAAKFLTIEFAADSLFKADNRFDVINRWVDDNNKEKWNEYQYNITAADVAAKKFTIDLTKAAGYKYDTIGTDADQYIGLCYWEGDGFVSAKITKITLSETAPADSKPADNGNTNTNTSGNKTNSKTGVESYIFIALGALLIAAAGAVVFARKASKA